VSFRTGLFCRNSGPSLFESADILKNVLKVAGLVAMAVVPTDVGLGFEVRIIVLFPNAKELMVFRFGNRFWKVKSVRSLSP
jgi:hypothetical protein